MARVSLLAIPLALASFAAAGGQQVTPRASTPLPGAPDVDYALTNVRIVTAPGKVIERGTIVTHDGRIAAVGATVNIPANAVRLDLAGHTVYPGMIDAATSTGLPSPTRAIASANTDAANAGRGGRGGGRGAAPPGGGRGSIPTAGRASAPPAPPVTEPEVDASAEAADQFSPTDDELKAFRAGGVTTVGLVFNGGLFPGRVGAALTGARGGSRLGLRSSVGQEVFFGTQRNAYPSVGIGAVAFIRQAYLDAEYENRVDKALKAGNPAARPSNDPFRRALMPAAANEMPSWFVAGKEREMTRVAEIAKEMTIKAPVVVGVQEGWRSIPTLKASNATAVVSLEWPMLDSVTGHNFLLYGVGKTGKLTPAEEAAGNNEIKANAAALVKAGVPVALASFGGASGATFRERVKSSIDAGLSPDDALRAVTVTPATILGINALVGTIETGKLANLVVVSGNDLFASGTPIKHVFVEGRLY
jgi:imidazolonepropionase-like amidohydrolase